MKVQRTSSNFSTAQSGLQDVGNSKGYRVLNEKRTVSKSAQSKIKNLAYTLSTPFRALMRQIIQSRTGNSANAAGVIKIKAATPPRTSPAENKLEPQLRPGTDYEVIGITEGYGHQSLIGRIWG